jgi:hypothetical protein
MLSKRLLWIAFVIVASCRAPQVSEDQLMAIDAAAANYLRASLKGPIALDPRANVDQHWVDVRSPRRTAGLAAALGAGAVMHDTTLVCGRTPADCSIRGFQTLVTLADPVVAGDTAKVTIRRWDTTGYQRVPLARQDSEIELVNESGRWRVTRFRVETASLNAGCHTHSSHFSSEVERSRANLRSTDTARRSIQPTAAAAQFLGRT